jgi:hypothetical protein
LSVSGSRWSIEELFQTGKGQIGNIAAPGVTGWAAVSLPNAA